MKTKLRMQTRKDNAVIKEKVFPLMCKLVDENRKKKQLLETIMEMATQLGFEPHQEDTTDEALERVEKWAIAHQNDL